MEQIVFLDTNHLNLLPLTYTRPTASLRVGILTIAEKWQKRFELPVGYITEQYLSKKYAYTSMPDQIIINGGLLPNNDVFEAISKLNMGQVLVKDNEFLAARIDDVETFSVEQALKLKKIEYKANYSEIKYPWNIFSLNGQEIEIDFRLLTEGRKSPGMALGCRIAGEENVFIEEGAVVQFATINAKKGSVYIGKDAEIMENSVVRGPFAMNEHAVLKMTSKIYGPTTIGPHSKVGGEINNSVIQGYSNKAHDGFLGNSVIGEWCNLGADTNNSNLKNNYAEVKVWNYAKEHFVKTGLQFCGLIMGDHSKCGINTMFNTGTVVGVSANIFGSGFPRNLIPSFSWGGSAGFTDFKLNKAFEVAKLVMERRGIDLDETEKDILTHIYDTTAKYRNFH